MAGPQRFKAVLLRFAGRDHYPVIFLTGRAGGRQAAENTKANQSWTSRIPGDQRRLLQHGDLRVGSSVTDNRHVRGCPRQYCRCVRWLRDPPSFGGSVWASGLWRGGGGRSRRNRRRFTDRLSDVLEVAHFYADKAERLT